MNLKTILSIIAGGVLMMFIAALNYTPAVASNSPDLKAAAVIEKSDPEPLTPEPLICIDCHRAPNINTNEGVIASRAFCYDCHSQAGTKKKTGTADVSLQITADTFDKNQPKHRFIACINCHTDVARSSHKTQSHATCLECHNPHSEGPANAPHLRVTCQACHFQSEFVRLDPEDNRVKLAHTNYDSVPIGLCEHIPADTTDEKTCEKCHFKKNPVGAPAAVLPSKSMLCIMCHNSPLAMGHPVFGLAGLIFVAGIFSMIAFWFKGSVKGEETSLHKKISLSSDSIWNTLFSKQFFSLIKTFILDVLFQRRILKESVSRWSMHSLIFTAVLLRFGLALFTAVGFYFNPEGNWMTALIDKNHWFTAFANDLLGLFILLGIIWAVVKRFIVKPDYVVSEYQDNITLVIIGSLVLLGFFLEGARILVTGIPFDTAVYSFVGYIVSKVFSIFPFDWASIYPVMWYAHGVVAAVFIAWLPFGKMRHIFNTPLTYFIETVDGVKNEKRV
ncbi:MAG: respiratory nitrate reductase subunit gamma [Desulfobacula sp.]|nr:respiratory nitrate reductase subunit gamma [Desulfobacula sp.]